MRPFEIGILLLVGLRLVVKSGPPARLSRAWKLAYPLLAVLVLGFHLCLEKVHWQMAPAYFLLILLAGSDLLSFAFYPSRSGRAQPAPGKSDRLLAASGRVLGWLVFAAGIALPLSLPVFRLPDPGGPYAVGLRAIELVDASRPEVFTPDPDDLRALVVHAWYPAQPEPGASAQSYWPEAKLAGPMVLERLGLPTFLLNHLPLVKTHTYPNAPLPGDSSRYPVLVFSHGYSTDYGFYWTQMEHLASHGYIIFSLSHPYEAIEASFPDGRTIFEDRAAWQALFGGSLQDVDLDARLLVWDADTRFVLDRLQQMDTSADDFFGGRLDLERVGIFGMSFGGATAMHVCLTDARCRAAANMDGSQYAGDDFDLRPLTVPALFFYSQDGLGMNDHIYERVENRAYRVFIHETEHNSYTDLGYWSPLMRYLSFLPFGVGEIAPQRMTPIVNAYLLAFFDRHLKNEAAPLLEGPSPFEEVDYQFR